MAQIIVTCDRWLGFGTRYIVRVDGDEAGRLGRKTKPVQVDVDPGRYTVAVDYNGRTTPVKHVLVEATDAVRFALQFGSVGAEVLRGIAKPWRERVSEPIGAPGVSNIMTLVSID